MLQGPVSHLAPESRCLGYTSLCRVLALTSLSLFMELRGWRSLICGICSLPSSGAPVNLYWNSLIPTTSLSIICCLSGIYLFLPISHHCPLLVNSLPPSLYFQILIPSSPIAGTSGTGLNNDSGRGWNVVYKTSLAKKGASRVGVIEIWDQVGPWTKTEEVLTLRTQVEALSFFWLRL